MEQGKQNEQQDKYSRNREKRKRGVEVGKSKKPEKIAPLPEPRGEVIELSLDRIVYDTSLQGRADGIKESVVKDYAAAYKTGADFPPITVVKVGGAYVLADGWHRVAALKESEQSTVRAEVIEGTLQTAMLIASRCNLKHGRQVTRKDKRLKFRLYVKAKGFLDENGQPKSYRDIAADLPTVAHYTTIGKWLKEYHTKIWERYYSGEAEGNPDFGDAYKERRRTENSLETMADDALRQALAASKGITDPDARGRLLETAKRVVDEIEKGGVWNPPDF